MLRGGGDGSAMFARPWSGGGSGILNGGKILLVCAATSLKQGTVPPKTGDCPQPGGSRQTHRSEQYQILGRSLSGLCLTTFLSPSCQLYKVQAISEISRYGIHPRDPELDGLDSGAWLCNG